MPKLLLEDSEGVQHELSMQTIQSESLKSGDVIVATYEVGDSDKQTSMYALNQLRQTLINSLPEGVSVIAIATRNGQEDISLKLLSESEVEEFDSSNNGS